MQCHTIIHYNYQPARTFSYNCTTVWKSWSQITGMKYKCTWGCRQIDIRQLLLQFNRHSQILSMTIHCAQTNHNAIYSLTGTVRGSSWCPNGGVIHETSPPYSVTWNLCATDDLGERFMYQLRHPCHTLFCASFFDLIIFHCNPESPRTKKKLKKLADHQNALPLNLTALSCYLPVLLLHRVR